MCPFALVRQALTTGAARIVFDAGSVLCVAMSHLLLLVPMFLLIIASGIDLKTREIPDLTTVALLTFAIAAAIFGWAGIQWWMVASGGSIGLVVGFLLFRFAEFGGGDSKVIAGVGAVLGPAGIWIFLFWTALAGGLLALVAKFRGQRDYAYGPAMLLGYTGYLIFHTVILKTVRELMTY